MPSAGSEGGLGAALVGEKVTVNQTTVAVKELLGEGGFAYVYLVKELSEKEANESGSSKRSSRNKDSSANGTDGDDKQVMVLKVTSILSRQQRDIAEKEAKLLSRLSHPSIVKMFDTCYRTVQTSSGGGFRKEEKSKERAQHLILMEYCDGGHSMEVCTKLVEKNERFDLSTLIIAFGQICNAVSYLHAQRPPIVHRDLKPENFLIKNGAYKLCDFGSAVFGHVELKTPQARAEAEEVIEKTTTQMYRAPEMVDLYMAKKLTQATDVWALGCCLYSLAFLKNCFEEGSNLAILSCKYKIPDENPYGDGLAELIDRMLTIDSKQRADMTEVILCLSAVYSGRPLPPRKEKKKDKKEGGGEKDKDKKDKKKKGSERAGTFRTDGQGIQEDLTIDPTKQKGAPVKKLDPNSAAARRRQAANAADNNMSFSTGFDNNFDTADSKDMGFSDNPFASFDSTGEGGGGSNAFASFDGDNSQAVDMFGSNDWDGGDFKDMAVNDSRGSSRDDHSRGRSHDSSHDGKKPRSRSQDHRRKNRKDRGEQKKDETPEEAIERLAAEDDDELNDMAESIQSKNKQKVVRRGVRRIVSSQQARSNRSHSRGAGLRRTKSGGAPSRRRHADDENDESSSGESSGSE